MRRALPLLALAAITACNQPLPIEQSSLQEPTLTALGGQIRTSSGQPATFLRIEIRGQQARFAQDCSGTFAYDAGVDLARVATDSAGHYRAMLVAGEFCVLLFARRDMLFVPIMSKSEFRTYGPPTPIDAVLPAGGTWDREGLPPAEMP